MGRQLSFLLLLLSLTLSVRSITGSASQNHQSHTEHREGETTKGGEQSQIVFQNGHQIDQNKFGIFSSVANSIQKFVFSVGSMFSSSDIRRDLELETRLDKETSHYLQRDSESFDISNKDVGSSNDRNNLGKKDHSNLHDNIKKSVHTSDLGEPPSLSETFDSSPHEGSISDEPSKHSKTSETNKKEDSALPNPRQDKERSEETLTFGSNRRLLWFWDEETTGTPSPAGVTEGTEKSRTDTDTALDPEDMGSGDQGVTFGTFPTDDEDAAQTSTTVDTPKSTTPSQQPDTTSASNLEEEVDSPTPSTTPEEEEFETPAPSTPEEEEDLVTPTLSTVDDTLVHSTPTTAEDDTSTTTVTIEDYDTQTPSTANTEETEPTPETEEEEEIITIGTPDSTDNIFTVSPSASATTDELIPHTLAIDKSVSPVYSTPAFDTTIAPTVIIKSLPPLSSTSLHGRYSTQSSVTTSQEATHIAPSPTMVDASTIPTTLATATPNTTNAKTPTAAEPRPVVSGSGCKVPAKNATKTPRRSRPSFEYVDLSTRSVYYLRSYYSRCDNCMEKWTSNRSKTQCPTYANQVLEFEKWAKEFSNILRYGCDGQGMSSDSRCCHGPQRQVSETISQMAQVSRTLTNTLRSQCSKCPVDCTWQEWSAWSQCPPPTCEGLPRNYRTRTRAANRERYGGRGCGGSDIERQACPFTPRVIGTWREWGPWSACSGSCSGVQTRNRTCTDPTICFTPCPGNRLEWRECGDDSLCCAQREWTSWGRWSAWMSEPQVAKSETSDLSVAARTRRRTCDVGHRRPGQMLCPDACPGVDSETEKCVESKWSEWSKWSACASNSGRFDMDSGEPCGSGFGRQSRTRTCAAGTCGSGCEGESTEYNTNCYLRPCCEAPVWTQWGDWGQCTSDGYQLRKRMCHADPKKWASPTCSRRPCQGLAEELQRCDVAPQALTAACSCTRRQWSEWGEWSPCGTEPGQSTRIKTRHRKCEGDPMSGQPLCPNACPGEDMETETCCTPSEWGPWSSWSPCSSSTDRRDHDTGEPCGNGQGYQNRTRVCIPGTCGLRCEGQRMENNMDCYVKPCCEHPKLSDWGQWEECIGSGVSGLAKSVKSRVQSRHRSCLPNPDNWESPVCRRNTACDNGGLVESRYCKCEIPEWTSWEPWTKCNFMDPSPSRSRTRSCDNPSRGSAECVHMCCAGADIQKQPCLCQKARYSSWGAFKDCKYNAGNLMMRRYRTCKRFDNPDYCDEAPYSWRHCVGRLMQEVPCCESYWTEWKPNGKCYTNAHGGPAQFTSRMCLWKEDCSSNLTKRLRPRCSGPSLDLVRCTPTDKRKKRSIDFVITVPENECEGRADGTYPSQHAGCNQYVICLNELPVKIEECKSHLLFDSVCQACVAFSETCDPTETGLDVNRFVKDIAHIKGNRSSCKQRTNEAESFLRYTRRKKRKESSPVEID